VLLVHGQPGAGVDWSPLRELLERELEVLAPDRPGWGDNRAGPVGLAANADALAVVLASSISGRRRVVVGHSLGGGIALEVALRHPALVGALVLVASVGVPEALTGFDRVLAVPVLGSGLVQAGVGAIRGSVAALSHLARGERTASAVRRIEGLPAVRAVRGDGVRPLVGRARRSFLVEQKALVAETPSLARRLHLLRVPVVVVSGSNDRVVPLGAARELAGRIPGAELVVLAGTHLLPFEHPVEVAAIVRRYAALAERG
jgi:pimeloyl-ACP methyl ester carboxylesterase